jgi:hypothetical protein
VKTRLVPPLSAGEAADLQAALLLDTADVMVAALQMLRPTPAAYCAAADVEDEARLRSLLPPGFAIMGQGRGDLGARLARVFERLLARHAGALAIGSDCPDLTPPTLRDALKALAGAEAVLGPAADGGYWAIGLTRPEPELFRDVPWSTSRVAAVTRRRLARRRTVVRELPMLRDVDRFDDLAAWAHAPNEAFARTVAWCRARGLA